MKRTRKVHSKKEGIPAPSVSACKADLWQEVETHYNKCMEYTQQGEWHGAYFNLMLAYTACKHYCLYVTNVTGVSKTTANQVVISEKAPLQTLERLLLAVPVYQRKIVQFQSHFGCKEESGATELEAACEEIKPNALEKASATLFTDVIGNRAAIEMIQDTIIYPHTMSHLYPNVAKGILFYGPPGTGKTLMARATAYELNQRSDSLRILFFAPTGEQLKGKYVGESEKKITQMFRCASRHACKLELKLQNKINVMSILFIDEVDSIARRRGGNDPSGVAANATNTFLQMMDGINSFPNVIVMGATNLPWNLDSAILRRFGQKICIPLPGEDDIVQLLKFYIVQWMKPIIFGDRAAPKRSYSNWFHRWRTLHNIREDELKILAAELVGTSSAAGYSPRDLSRLCQEVFKLTRKDSQHEASFYQVRMQKDVVQTTLSENEFEIFHALEGKYASDMSFKDLTEHFPNIVDPDITPNYPGAVRHPLQILCTKPAIASDDPMPLRLFVHYTLLSVKGNTKVKFFIQFIRSLGDDVHVYVRQTEETTRFFENLDVVEDEDSEYVAPLQFVLYKEFKINVDGVNHGLPLMLFGAISRTDLREMLLPGKLKNMAKWIWSSPTWSVDMKFFYDRVQYVRYYFAQVTYEQSLTPLVERDDADWYAKTVLKTDVFTKLMYDTIIIRNSSSTWTDMGISDAPKHVKAPESLVIKHFVKGKVHPIRSPETVSIKRNDENMQGKNIASLCFNLHLDIKTFVTARKTILASAKIVNVRAIDEYHKKGTIPDS
jgi:SpoVK/Ycf46/Vps4 family AAA+-type ATPase